MSEFANKTVLVTGATGLIGSHLVKKLMNYGDVKVIALSRSENKLKKGFSEYLGKDNFRIIAQDASLPIDSIGEHLDYIFHAAGPIAGSVIREYPVDVILPNIMGTLNVINYIEKQNQTQEIDCKLVVFSSATVYSNLADHDVKVSEDNTSVADALDAVNAPYSESKRMVEVIAKAYAKQKGISAKIVRFSYVYGFTQFMPSTAFYKFVKTAMNGGDITLNNAGLPRRDNIYVDDAVDGLLTVALKGENGESYNVSTSTESGNFAAVDEMALIIADAVNKKKGTNVAVKYKNSGNGKRLPGIILDNQKLHDLGWCVKTSIVDGINETVELLMSNKATL